MQVLILSELLSDFHVNGVYIAAHWILDVIVESK